MNDFRVTASLLKKMFQKVASFLQLKLNCKFNFRYHIGLLGNRISRNT